MKQKYFHSLADKINPVHTAILVIDVQNDFCSSEGAVSSKEDWHRIQTMLPRLRKFLDNSRDYKIPVIFVQMIQGEDDLSNPMEELLARRGRLGLSCKRGSWGAEFVKNVYPKVSDFILKKNRYSAFVNTDLETLLSDWGIRTLILTGVTTNVCVESTARDGFMRDYYIVLPKDLVAAYYEAFHEIALRNIDAYFGQVVSAAELLKIWQAFRNEVVEV